MSVIYSLKIIKKIILVGLFFSLCPANADDDCVISTLGTANFGTYNPLDIIPYDVTFINLVSVSCDDDDDYIQYSIGVSNGNGTCTQRRLQNSSSSRINYNLYTNPARTLIWGNANGTCGNKIIRTNVKCKKNKPCSETIYGRIPSPQSSVTPGTYTDTLFVTLTY